VGKTRLLAELLVCLKRRGLRVGAVKHAAHGFELDRAGSDSARIFGSGGEGVALIGPAEVALRMPAASTPEALPDRLRQWFPRADLVLVEGFKTAGWPRIWVGDQPAPFDPVFRVTVGQRPTEGAVGRDDVELLADRVWRWLAQRHGERRVVGGVLLGGASSRMGRPKHLMDRGPETWLERIAGRLSSCVDDLVLLGRGEVPPGLNHLDRLPDPPGVAGPIAGVLALMRQRPDGACMVVACDAPDLESAELEAMVGARRPGVDAVVYRVDGQDRPLPILLEAGAARAVERRARSERRSLRGLLSGLRVEGLEWGSAEERRLVGYNTPAELDE
jgi:molybdopterin-guanine dinucleotide biosynthesis protein MobB